MAAMNQSNTEKNEPKKGGKDLAGRKEPHGDKELTDREIASRLSNAEGSMDNVKEDQEASAHEDNAFADRARGKGEDESPAEEARDYERGENHRKPLHKRIRI